MTGPSNQLLGAKVGACLWRVKQLFDNSAWNEAISFLEWRTKLFLTFGTGRAAAAGLPVKSCSCGMDSFPSGRSLQEMNWGEHEGIYVVLLHLQGLDDSLSAHAEGQQRALTWLDYLLALDHVILCIKLQWCTAQRSSRWQLEYLKSASSSKTSLWLHVGRKKRYVTLARRRDLMKQ